MKKTVKFCLFAITSAFCLFFGNARPSEEQREQSSLISAIEELKPEAERSDSRIEALRKQNKYIEILKTVNKTLRAGCILFDHITTTESDIRDEISIKYTYDNYKSFADS